MRESLCSSWARRRAHGSLRHLHVMNYFQSNAHPHMRNLYLHMHVKSKSPQRFCIEYFSQNLAHLTTMCLDTLSLRILLIQPKEGRNQKVHLPFRVQYLLLGISLGCSNTLLLE